MNEPLGQATPTSARGLILALERMLGKDACLTDERTLETARWDISGPGEGRFLAVCLPGTVGELQEVVRLSVAANVAVVPRGGAQSYTGGIWPPANQAAIALDVRRLDRIANVDTANRTVTVEAGCTWENLYKALKSQGLRTPFFGPLSGVKATIGGTLSQNGAFFGSARFGSASQNVLGLDVVLADGSLVSTGTSSIVGVGPLNRLPSSDLTSLFVGDAGALGIKARATLPVMHIPQRESYASIGFDNEKDLLNTMAALAESNCDLSEVWGFDPGAHKALSASGFSRLEQAKIVGQLLRGRQGLLSNIKGLMRIGMSGGSAFVGDLRYSLHMVGDGSEAASSAAIESSINLAKRYGGTVLPDAIPRATRAKPFRPIKSLIAHDGALWLPVHGIVGIGDAARLAAAVNDVLARAEPLLERHGIRLSRLYATVGNQCIIEPQFFWKDRPSPFHAAHVGEEQLSLAEGNASDPEATRAVKTLRKQLVAAMDQVGAVHFQPGRTYGVVDRLAPTNRALLATIKGFLDPKGLINPGVTTA